MSLPTKTFSVALALRLIGIGPQTANGVEGLAKDGKPSVGANIIGRCAVFERLRWVEPWLSARPLGPTLAVNYFYKLII